MEERRLRAFENGVLRKIFGPKRNEVTLMGRAYSSYKREKRGVYGVLVGKYEGKRSLGRTRHGGDDNIKMDLELVGCGFMDWIELAQDRDR